jgi:hypothetical protein
MRVVKWIYDLDGLNHMLSFQEACIFGMEKVVLVSVAKGEAEILNSSLVVFDQTKP